MQASGTVNGKVRMSYFCKYLLRSGTRDWDVAVHIKEHHITHTWYHPEGADRGRVTQPRDRI